MAVAIITGFVALVIAIMIYGVKSVYDLMDGVDDKQNCNHPKKQNDVQK